MKCNSCSIQTVFFKYKIIVCIIVGLEVEGIYRVSGTKSKVDTLKESYDQGKCSILIQNLSL